MRALLVTLIVTLSGVLIRGNGSEIDALDLEREVINLKYVICFTIQNKMEVVTKTNDIGS